MNSQDLRRAVNMRLRGATYDKIARVCGFPDGETAAAAIEEYTSRWFTNG